MTKLKMTISALPPLLSQFCESLVGSRICQYCVHSLVSSLPHDCIFIYVLHGKCSMKKKKNHQRNEGYLLAASLFWLSKRTRRGKITELHVTCPLSRPHKQELEYVLAVQWLLFQVPEQLDTCCSQTTVSLISSGSCEAACLIITDGKRGSCRKWSIAATEWDLMYYCNNFSPTTTVTSAFLRHLWIWWN